MDEPTKNILYIKGVITINEKIPKQIEEMPIANSAT